MRNAPLQDAQWQKSPEKAQGTGKEKMTFFVPLWRGLGEARDSS